MYAIKHLKNIRIIIDVQLKKIIYSQNIYEHH